VKTKIIEVTNGNRNWGKFMLARMDTEWERMSTIGTDSVRPLLAQCGWTHQHIWVLDLQTGEGVLVRPDGNAHADLEHHKVWVCPMFEPFLAWLYARGDIIFEMMPDFLDLPDAEFMMQGHRRPGPGTGVQSTSWAFPHKGVYTIPHGFHTRDVVVSAYDNDNRTLLDRLMVTIESEDEVRVSVPCACTVVVTG
jgi:hypothetical protein